MLDFLMYYVNQIRKKLLSLLILFFLIFLPLKSERFLRFEKFSKYNLVSDLININAILQDRNGLIWIVVNNGIYTYNGYSLKNIDADSDSIPSNMISSMVEDTNGKVWFGSKYGHLFYYDTIKRKFVNLDLKLKPNIYYNNARINTLYADLNGTLWIGTAFNGLISFDTKTDKIIKRYIDQFQKIKRPVLSILIDKKKNILIGTNRGLYTLNKKDELNNYFIKNSSLLDIRVNKLLEDSQNRLWIGTDKGVIVLFGKDKNILHFKKNIDQNNSLSDNLITSILEDKKRDIWIGTSSGLNRLKTLKTGVFEVFKNNNNIFSLSGNSINNLIEDRSGIIWITTINGINLYKPDIKFNNKNSVMINQTIGQNKNITRLEENKDEILWLTTRNRLYKFDKKKNKIEYCKKIVDTFINEYKQQFYLYNDLLDDNNGSLWISGSKYLFRFNNKDYSYQKFDYPAILSISTDQNNNLWFGSVRHGLISFNRKTNSFIVYNKNNSNIRSLNVTYIFADKNNKDLIWIGYTNAGISSFNIKTKEFKNYYLNNGGNRIKIYVSSINMSKKNPYKIWITTVNYGLIKYDYFKRKTRFFSKDIKLPKFLLGAVIDKKERLWISSQNNGLFLFDIKSEDIQNFTKEDGLNNNRYFYKSYYLNQKGQILFGGYQGLDIIDPKQIKKNNSYPLIVLSKFNVYNKDNALIKDVLNKKEVNINHDEKFIIKFAATDYYNPQKNRYAYKLEGYNKNWVYTDSLNREITYMNIPAGQYYFKVKGSNNDQIWSKNNISIKITVYPPFWGTWWFRIVIILLFLYLIFIWHKTRMKRLAKKLKTELSIEQFCNKYSITSREHEIVMLILQGKSNKEIEAKLFISAGTVRNHIYSIFKKFNIKSRIQLITLFKEFNHTNKH